MTTAIPADRRQRQAAWLLLAGACIVGLAVAVIPMSLIMQPFRAQSAGDLAVSATLLRIGPWVTLVAALLAIIAAIWLWRRSSSSGWVKIVRRVGLAVLAVVTVAAAGFSRAHIVEWMFSPIRDAQFVAAGRAQLQPKDIVLDVDLGGQARAYPVGEMAFHHLVNDRLAGTPLVATY